MSPTADPADPNARRYTEAPDQRRDASHRVPDRAPEPPPLAPHPDAPRPGRGPSRAFAAFVAVIFAASILLNLWMILRGASFTLSLRLGDPVTSQESHR